MAAPIPRSIIDEANQIEWEQNRLFNRLGGQTSTLAEQQQMASDGDRLRNLFADLEMVQPEPEPTDTPYRYQAKLLAGLAQHTRWRDSNLIQPGNRHLLNQMATAIEQEARAVAADRTVGSFRNPGQLREIRRVDAGGNHISSFHGKPDSWMSSFKTCVSSVVESFNVPKRR